MCGAQNKKRRLKLEAERDKLSGSLNKFLQLSSSLANPLLSREEQVVAEPMIIIEDQQPSTSGSSGTPVSPDPTPKLGHPVSENEERSEHSDIADISDIDIADPSTWPNNLSHHLIQSIVTKGAVQIKENFPVDESGRKFSATQYLRKLPNGEIVNRDWLVYSKKINCVFCIFCKVFSALSHQLTTGYSNWRHLSVNISRHENSMEHMKGAQKWHELKLRLSKDCTIDKEQQHHYENEKRRWRAIIKRMICIVQYLASQNLAFRGDSSNLFESNNGNFLKLVETIAKFDPIMMEHLSNIQRSKELKKKHAPLFRQSLSK